MPLCVQYFRVSQKNRKVKYQYIYFQSIFLSSFLKQISVLVSVWLMAVFLSRQCPPHLLLFPKRRGQSLAIQEEPRTLSLGGQKKECGTQKTAGDEDDGLAGWKWRWRWQQEKREKRRNWKEEENSTHFSGQLSIYSIFFLFALSHYLSCARNEKRRRSYSIIATPLAHPLGRFYDS